jgi:hypothetical protein
MLNIMIILSIVICTKCDYRRVLDSWSDLLDSLTRNSWPHFTNYCHTKTSVLSLLESPLAFAW